MPSSPDECTATPSWNVSQTPAALTHGADAAPERRVEQDHVDRGIEHVRGELLEVHDDGVGRERHAHLLAHAAHAVQAVHRILEVVVAQILDRLPEADGLLGRPDAVAVEADRVAGERGRDARDSTPSS